MKKIIASLIITFVFYTLHAQTGNVGIGTAIPGSKLTVNGSIAAPYNIVTAGGNVGANDFYTAYNSASNGTLTLPAATVAAPPLQEI
ncbi:MAG: hypothetical protein WDM90_00375 [Ferruginibacter sp.]